MFQLLWSDPKKSFTNSIFLNKKNIKKYKIAKTSFLMWEEHCIECAPLESNSTCFHPRRDDNQCASFLNGIEENFNVKSIEGFGIEVVFRKWAKLETQWPFSPKMYKINNFKILFLILNSLQKFNKKIYNLIKFVPKSYYICKIITSLYNRIFPYLSTENKNINEVDGFLVEFYSTSEGKDDLIFEIVKESKPIFKYKINFKNGWNQEFIPYSMLSNQSKKIGFFRIWVESQKDTKIIFTALHLVKFENSIATIMNKPADKVKCVVFDLDNTLWEGVVGDDGDKVEIKRETVDFIKALDEKGIICSIASKNDYNTAWSMINKFGLKDYFLFSKINWGQKSENIKTIAKEMNVNVDTLAFIDDSIFEREEVKSALPQVRTYDVIELKKMNELPEFDVPITSQSHTRRISYLENIERDKEYKISNNNFDHFLMSCKMKISIYESIKNFDRCHELISRTNQFNISGKKFNIEEFKKLLVNEKSFCWNLSDKFGNYGIVGFLSFIEKDNEILVTNFVLSCRAAEKKVEETLFDWIQKKYNNKDIKIKFTKTKKNNPIFNKLEDMRLIKTKNEDFNIYTLDKKSNLLNENFIEIVN
jgi:FkbH-like protein